MTLIAAPAISVYEQTQEDFDPLPRVALADSRGTALTHYLAVIPLGDRYVVEFEIDEDMITNSALLRYSKFVPPTRIWFISPKRLKLGDTFHLTIHPA